MIGGHVFAPARLIFFAQKGKILVWRRLNPQGVIKGMVEWP